MRAQIATSRKTELDALRILACFMVVCIHVTVQAWYHISVKSLAWQCLNLCNCLMRGSVPVFIMLSGINFLKEEKPLAVLFRKYILRIAVIFFLWTFLYALDKVGLSSLNSIAGLKSLIVQCFRWKYHLWYLANTVGAYLILPLMWCIVRWQNGKYVKYICIVLFGYQTLLSIIQTLPKQTLTLPAIRVFSPHVGIFVCLMLLGYYLYEKSSLHLSTAKWIAIFFATVLLAAAVNGFLSFRADKPLEATIQSFGFFSIVQGICLLQIFKNLRSARLFTKGAAGWKWLSACTLGIYLLHVFVIEHLEQWFDIAVFSAPLPVSLPLLSAGVFLICLIITAGLRRIPFVEKWIV